uniref:Methyltransferase FkbM domain-containing protein n=1 Tax=Plectus sambesii TaxID=2011161 RepID=A0A914XKS0_9BILA
MSTREFEVTEVVGLSPDSSTRKVPGSRWSDYWSLTPLTQLTTRYSPNVQQIISLLTLDLDGSEWDILGGLLDSGVLKRFRQISFRLRIWFGEENENYRRFYSWFVRLERQGFHKLAFRHLQESARDIVFVSL